MSEANSANNEGLIIVSEDACKSVIDRDSAFTAVENVFASMSKGDAYNFPVIREAIGYADALYGFKSGFDRAGKSLGLKSGGYWPGNAAKGFFNILFQCTGLNVIATGEIYHSIEAYFFY